MMFKKIYFVLFIFVYLFSFEINALDYSGTYQGVKCTRNATCVDGDSGKGLLTNFLKSINFKSVNRILILVDHDLKNESVTLFFPDFDYMFKNMPLEGDHFTGSDDKSGNTDIDGNFIGDIIKVTFIRYPGQDNSQTFWYKGSLTKNDILLRKKLDEIIVKDKNIQKLQNKNKDLQSEVAQLKKTIENKIEEINKLEKRITNLNDKLKDTIKTKDNKLKDTINIKDKEKSNLEKTYKNKIAELKKEHNNKKEELLIQIEKCISKPIRIDASFLEKRSKTNQDTTLYTAPSDQVSKVETLKDGTLVENLKLVGSNKDWALVVTETGLIGYIFTDHLREFGPEGPLPPPPGGEDISITLPQWDSGRKGQLMTVEPGFVSIIGQVNIEAGVLEIQLNGSVCDPPEQDGSFECFYIIESGDNDVTIKVIDRNNAIHELSFIIRGN